MKLVCGAQEFTVSNFNETLSLNGNDYQMDLNFTLTYYDSLENLTPVVDDLDFSVIAIVDGDDSRTYNGYSMSNIDQQVNGLHQISTNLRLTKIIKESTEI